MSVALITGVGGGLGAYCAKHLAEKHHCDLFLHYHHNEKGAIKLQQEIQKKGQRAEIFSANLSNPEELEALQKKFHASFPQLDTLINNAGSYEEIPLEELTLEQWLNGFHSTATATFLMTQSFREHIRKSSNGRIINIGDGKSDSLSARKHALGYHIGKSGIQILTRSFAKTEAPHGTTINMISPGVLEKSNCQTSPMDIPSGRLGTYEDITQALDFLLHPKSTYLTGNNLKISGGWSL